jgi:hypothetical protein
MTHSRDIADKARPDLEITKVGIIYIYSWHIAANNMLG